MRRFETRMPDYARGVRALEETEVPYRRKTGVKNRLTVVIGLSLRACHFKGNTYTGDTRSMASITFSGCKFSMHSRLYGQVLPKHGLQLRPSRTT